MDKQIFSFCGLSETETIVGLKEENLLFSIPNKKFIENTNKNLPCKR